MAEIYVRSGAGGSATGASWANACLTLAAGITVSAAGDNIWVAGDHAETAASAKTHTFKGTVSNPNRVLCADHTGSVPPVAADLRTTGTVTTTGANGIVNSGYAYVYGVSFICGTGAGGGNLTLLDTGGITYESCLLSVPPTINPVISLTLTFTASSPNTVNFINCSFTFGTVNATLRWRGGIVRIIGGSVAATGSVPTQMVTVDGSGGGPGTLVFDGVNLSAFGSGTTLVGGNTVPLTTQFVNCRLGSSVTVSATPTSLGQTTSLIISDSSTSNSRQELYRYSGTLTTETTIIRTGGASNGTTGISWKVVTTANAKLAQPFECFEAAIWNATTGGAKTVTVEIVNDGTTLTNAEAWIDVEYLGSSSYPLASLVSSKPATILTTPTNCPTSSVTWTTTGLGSPVKQYLAATFTPNMVGLVRVRVYLARASKTVYVDPKLTVT